jgi:general secretion pathway protein D
MVTNFMRRSAFILMALGCLTAPGLAQPAPSQPAAPAVASTATTSADASGITLNFVNADVRDVAKAVLGDYLKLNYEIGSNVTGTVTLQTSQPLRREQVLPALEQALSLNNLALLHANGIYEVMPLADAHKQVGLTPGHIGNTASGYGVDVVHVHYMSADQMQKLIAPLASTEGAIRIDPSRNLLIVEGTAQERAALLEDISLFDVDSMSGMSFELFTPQNMDADELAKELNGLMGGISGQMGSGVRLIPIDRLNAVLAISPQQRYLSQMRIWVSRLDKPGQGNDKKIFVYHVQNGRASDIANTLLKTLFGAAAGTTTTTQAPSPFSSQSGGSMSGSTNTFGSSSLLGGGTSITQGSTQPSHPSTSFAPVTNPTEEREGGHGRPFETIGGVAREGINSVNITADETNNALVVLATPREYAVIQDALRQLDIAPIQVLLEAAIAEVTLTNETQFGVQFYLNGANNQGVLTQGSTVPLSNTNPVTGATNPSLVNIAAPFPGFSYMYTNGANIQVILNALDQITHVDVISSPEVMVLNNQLASLEVGDQVPILSGEAQSTVTADSPVVNSVEYLDTGIILKVTPRVNRSGQVMMDISQEVSGVDNTATSSNTIGSPTIQQRKIDSSVSVTDGQTVALGGLFSDSHTTGFSGIPILDRIPLLGNLFGSNDDQHNRTELMVLITPHVVDNPEKARAVTDELRRKLPEVEPLFDKKG